MLRQIRKTANFIVNPTSLLLSASLLVLTACSNDSAPDVSTQQQSGVAIQLPEAIASRISDQTNGTLSATISIDGGPAQAMTISGNSASATLSNIAAGSHSFTIVFVFDHDLYDPLTVASATKTLNVAAGNNSLSFATTDYDLSFDEDGDGVPNIIELDPASTTNPTISLCILADTVAQSTAQLGSCELG